MSAKESAECALKKYFEKNITKKIAKEENKTNILKIIFNSIKFYFYLYLILFYF